MSQTIHKEDFLTSFIELSVTHSRIQFVKLTPFGRGLVLLSFLPPPVT